MNPVRSTARPLATAATGIGLFALVIIVLLAFAAPSNVHPFFYFGLIFLGGGAISLLFAGIGASAAAARDSGNPALDLRFFQGIRSLVLAMWVCAVIVDVLGVMVLLVVADGAGGAPVGAATLILAFLVAVLTAACGGVIAIVIRRQLPQG